MADIGLSTASREVMLKVVKDRVALEVDMRERGECIEMRVPRGRSLHHVIMNRSPELEWDVPAFAHGGGFPVDDKWIAGKAEFFG
jgi:hypothetical protein